MNITAPIKNGSTIKVSLYFFSTTFLKREESVEIIQSSSLPIGMLNQMDYEVYSKKLYDGDNVQTELKRLEKQRDEYLDLYRNLLDKLDQLTIENLNYKKKGK